MALSKGSKLVLASAVLLFFDLFFTWQQLEVDFGPAGTARQPLDGWDAWGLLIGLLTLAIVALVIVVRVTDVDVSPDVPWNQIIVWLSGIVFVVTVLKNLTDADSAWASYIGIILAATTLVGAFRTRAEEPRALTVADTPTVAARDRSARDRRPAYRARAESEHKQVETAARKW